MIMNMGRISLWRDEVVKIAGSAPWGSCWMSYWKNIGITLGSIEMGRIKELTEPADVLETPLH